MRAGDRRGRLRLLVLEYQPTCPPGLLVPAAKAAGVDLEVIAAGDGDQGPSDLGGAAGLVVLGGEFAAYDPHPAMARSMALIRAAAARGAPTLGICPGAQLAAHALAAAPTGTSWSALNSAGCRSEVTRAGRADPVVGQLGDPAEVFDWHRDTFTLPPDAILLARSASYRQAFRVGSVVGIQWHPGRDLVASWYEGQAAAAEEAGYPLADAVDGADRHLGETRGATGRLLPAGRRQLAAAMGGRCVLRRTERRAFGFGTAPPSAGTLTLSSWPPTIAGGTRQTHHRTVMEAGAGWHDRRGLAGRSSTATAARPAPT